MQHKLCNYILAEDKKAKKEAKSKGGKVRVLCCVIASVTVRNVHADEIGDCSEYRD